MQRRREPQNFMLKGVTAAFYGLVLLFLGFLPHDAVDMKMAVARDVEAGKQFDVTVTVKKGGLESFARFQADLPRGLKAVSGSAENANFRFEGNQVKFVWMRLPESPEFQLKYTVRVDPRLRGEFELGGEMAYISENARKVSALKGVQVRITPSAGVAPDQQIDLAEYQRQIPAQRDISLSKSQVRCIRETPTAFELGGDLMVRLLINRGEALKFAKIEEHIPEGYTAEPVESKEAIFSCEEGVVKFLWMTLPPEPMFTVSYRLIPLGGTAEGTPQIRGTFSFVQDEATRVIGITQRNIQLKNMSNEELERLVRNTPVQQPQQGHTPTRPTASGGTLIPQGPSEGGVDLPVQYRQIPTASRIRSSARRPDMDRYLLTPEEGIYYRVQVAAGHRPININRYFKRLSLHADVRTERHDGWYKYSVGSFKEYKEARDYRTQVWNTTPIRDAFVAAYNNGQRITVQEALMITSQKWYR